MDFYTMLDQAIAVLRQRQRVTYRALKRQFALDDDALEDLKAELLYAHPQVRDDAGQGLVWTGEPTPGPAAASSSAPRPLLADLLVRLPALVSEPRKSAPAFVTLFGRVGGCTAGLVECCLRGHGYSVLSPSWTLPCAT